MPLLHEPSYNAEILRRVRALTPDSPRQWGRMTIGQMLWHVNEAMESALGHVTLPPQKVPLPRPLMKLVVIYVPWPKGAPTLKPWEATSDTHDFATERARCVRLIEEFAARPIDGDWPRSPSLGRMSGREVSRLQAKHLNHHLKQFGQ